MKNSEISDLTRLLPAPAAHDLPTDRTRVLRDGLLAEFRQAHETTAAATRRRRPARRPLLVALASACALGLAAAIGIGVAGSGAGAPAAGASPAAATLLARIADAAGRQPNPQVRDSEFMYIRSEVAFTVYTVVNGHQSGTMEKPHERQVWLPVANICRTGLLIENGFRTPLSVFPVSNGKVTGPPPGLFTGCGMGNLGDPTYRLLQLLPTDPRTLLNLIYRDSKGQGQAIGPNGVAFIYIGNLIREAIVPPRTAAALYRAAALIPGVTFIGRTANAVGRPGIAIAFTSRYDRNEWIFDPATLQFIGERDYDMTTGKVNGDTAILQRAFVAKAGELPRGH